MDSRQISEIPNIKYEIRNGSAIILAIFLTTLLAIVGVLFLFSSRVDSTATSAVVDNQDLKLAVDTVVSQISQKLVIDTPGFDPNGSYYDYPDPCTDYWLACLEPYYKSDTNDYRWRHVTDLYNNFGLAANNVKADIIPEYQPTVSFGLLADADGDGVGDSNWVPIQAQGNVMTSSKGKPIYAAIRIIDNGGMLNINTAYKFNPNSSVGSTQLDINLMAIAALDNTHDTYIGETQDRLWSYRCGTADANFYEPNVVWQYGLPSGTYTPFDISDELNLRNRYIINRSNTTRNVSRIELLWRNAFDGPPYAPRDTQNYSITNSADWFWIVSNNYPALCPDPCKYDNRHIATTYNFDRIINPAGSKMFNINSLASVKDVNIVRNAIRTALDSSLFDANQIAVNLVDYLDTDSNVTYYVDPCTSNHYFGFETPCIYISEIAQNFYKPADANIDPNTYSSYAIELFKPYSEDGDLNGWYIETKGDISATPKITPIVWTGTKHFHVLADINTGAIDANIPIDINDSDRQAVTGMNFGPLTTITLWRDVNGYGLMPVDSFVAPDININTNWMAATSVSPLHSIERDINSIHRCIRRVSNPIATNLPTIGKMNSYDSGSEKIQAHPANKPFTNIGEIGQLFRTDAYLTGPLNDEASVRLNLADPNVQNLFKYLTVMDPYPLYNSDSNETRIKGRININTAPWFVLAQLPWISYHTPNYDLARSIVNYRDAIHGAFKNIGELMIDANSSINSIGYYQGETVPIPTTLLTPTDSIGFVGDVFEERDVIFDRISNLVTVRSDVFTAYILVRIGKDGPQKRVIAIFDRSEVPKKPVKIIAIQPVPDPR